MLDDRRRDPGRVTHLATIPAEGAPMSAGASSTPVTTTAPDARASGWVTALVVVQGFATIVASVLFLPAGGALILANAVGAADARGRTRALFATFAIAGAIVLVCVLVFGFPASVTQEVTVVRQ
jgi:hypothetical protein